MTNEAQLDRVEKKLDALLAHLGLSANGAKPKAAAGELPVATDEDLDSPYGNFEVRKDPPRWKGQTYVGHRIADTEPAYLDVLAGFLEWKAMKNDEEQKVSQKTGRPLSEYDRKDAARVRGWAARLRAQGPSPKAPAPRKPAPAQDDPYGYGDGSHDAMGDDSDLPF